MAISAKDKARRQRGVQVAKQKQMQRIKSSKAERRARSEAAADNDVERRSQKEMLQRSSAGGGERPVEGSDGLGRAGGFAGGMGVDEFLEGGFEHAMDEMEDEESEEEEEEVEGTDENDDDDDDDDDDDEDEDSEAEEEEAPKSAKKKAGSLSKHKDDLQARVLLPSRQKSPARAHFYVFGIRTLES